MDANNDSVFGLLNFVPNPNPEKSALLELLCNMHKETKKSINLHDAAIITAHLGIPEDLDSRETWEKLTFSDKIAHIYNLFGASHQTSFTKIF